MSPAIDDPRHDREAGVRDATLDTTRIDDVRIAANVGMELWTETQAALAKQRGGK